MDPPRHDHLSFRGNLKATRYGWLRLTPAYSVHLVGDLLAALPPGGRVLDPFCGTGTTALVCAERGIACDTTDINPFLLWLAAAKTRAYTARQIAAFSRRADEIAVAMATPARTQTAWTPELHQIEKWWDRASIATLAAAFAELRAQRSSPTRDLLEIVFCRTLIESANVSFGHQSMSFKDADVATPRARRAAVIASWRAATVAIAASATSPIALPPRAIHCDARSLPTALRASTYTCVITSPPYPNRMSYIRELRPYMYWLGYLRDGRAAGELDWQAIGGTWGVATSNLGKWQPTPGRTIPHAGFDAMLAAIAVRSRVLSRYVHKYFDDMIDHVAGLYRVVARGGTVHYVIGNSKFYDVMVSAEEIFASLFRAAGFADVEVRTIRKRTSKKELFEYVVSARKP